MAEALDFDSRFFYIPVEPTTLIRTVTLSALPWGLADSPP